MKKELVINKEKAVSFYRLAFLGNPKEAVEKYVGVKYIQHNPLVNDGPKAFSAYFERMHQEYPKKKH